MVVSMLWLEVLFVIVSSFNSGCASSICFCYLWLSCSFNDKGGPPAIHSDTALMWTAPKIKSFRRNITHGIRKISGETLG